MKTEKWPREKFRRIAARQLMTIIDLMEAGQEIGTKELLTYLTMTLASLDHYQGANVSSRIKFTDDEEVAELSDPVADLLRKEGGSVYEVRFRNEEFWVGFIIEAERELRGFTKRKQK